MGREEKSSQRTQCDHEGASAGKGGARLLVEIKASSASLSPRLCDADLRGVGRSKRSPV